MNVIKDVYIPNDSEEILFRKDINAHIYGGGNVSHLLNIVSRGATNDIANQIRQQVFDKINNVPITFTIGNLDVTITWRSNAVSNYYHADVMGIYGDLAVSLHAKMLLEQFDMSACDRRVTFDFIVTKPLTRTIPLSSTEINNTIFVPQIIEELNKTEEPKLCQNIDCERYPPDWDFEEDTEENYEDGQQWVKCNLCAGYFNDDGLGDILFIEEEPNNKTAQCGLCGKDNDIVQMKGTGEYLCGNACDEESDDED